MRRRLAAWWLRLLGRFPLCYTCDRYTLLRHHHHDVHPNLHPVRFTRRWRPSR